MRGQREGDGILYDSDGKVLKEEEGNGPDSAVSWNSKCSVNQALLF